MQVFDRHLSDSDKTPKVTFENEDMRIFKETHCSHEIRTAEKLSRHGIRCCFVNDNVQELDRNGKPTGRSLNYADLDNGMEIKVLNSASSYNTINGHLKNASKKLNATSVVFDNSENKCLTDEKLAEYLRRSQAFKYGSVYMLTCEDRLIRIK